jgi:hypothetical protein
VVFNSYLGSLHKAAEKQIKTGNFIALVKSVLLHLLGASYAPLGLFVDIDQ